MSHDQHDPEEEAEARRPRVVDKRISAREASGQSPPAAPVEPAVPPPVPEPGPVTSPPAPQHEPTPAPDADELWTPEQEAQARKMAEEMAEVPSLDWVINVAVTLANAASVKLNTRQMEDASLAIDALAGLMSSVGARLGDAETPLRQTVAEMQMAYAQMAGASAQPPPQPAP